MGLFQRPEFFLWGFVVLTAAYVFGLWADSRRQSILELFARAGILSRLTPQGVGRTRRLRDHLRWAAMGLIFIALAGPQWGVELVQAHYKGSQIMIAVDTSLSMLAEDLKPNRIQKSKSALTLLIDGLAGNRVGLIAFAGEAFIQCPLTTDISAVKSFLRRMKTGMIPTPGTALTGAIELGARTLRKYPGHKSIVLLTDGEDHDGQPLAAATAAAREGIHLYIIGMGTPEGGPIPLKGPNGRTIGYKKDKRGETVITSLAEASLVELAAASNGAYYRATPLENEINSIIEHILDLEKSDMVGGAQNRFKNRFRIPLALALLILLIELLIPATALSAAPKKPSAPALLSFAALSLMLTGCDLPSNFNLHRGNSKYSGKDYERALAHYKKGDPRDAMAPFNKGAALYQMEKFEEAQKTYEDLAESGQTPAIMAPKTYYNLGNTLYRQDDLKGAAQAYKRCLLLDPMDEDCRHNLVMALRPPKNKKKKKHKKSSSNNKKEKEKGGQPDPTNPRPRNRKNSPSQGLSKEDAERILRALREKEKAAQQALSKRRLSETPPKNRGGADW